MLFIDENGIEVNIDINAIDKATLYLKMEDRKRVDIEYLENNISKLCVVIVKNAAELIALFTKIGDNIFIKENVTNNVNTTGNN